VLVALADTHATGDPPLTDHLRGALRDADVVVHAGDFTAAATLAAFRDLATAAGADFAAVHGNSDSAAVRADLPAVRTVEALGERALLVHGHDHSRTQLSMLARQEEAGVAVVGHTHRAGVTRLGGPGAKQGSRDGAGSGNGGGEQQGGLTVVNPGSHADPRGSQPAYARVHRRAGAVDVELRSPAGDVL
jgi:putative phosphoesterase